MIGKIIVWGILGIAFNAFGLFHSYSVWVPVAVAGVGMSLIYITLSRMSFAAQGDLPDWLLPPVRNILLVMCSAGIFWHYLK